MAQRLILRHTVPDKECWVVSTPKGSHVRNPRLSVAKPGEAETKRDIDLGEVALDRLENHVL